MKTPFSAEKASFAQVAVTALVYHFFGYIMFAANLGYTLSIFALCGVAVTVLQDAYAINVFAFLYHIPLIGAHIPQSFTISLGTAQVLWIYGVATFATYLIGAIVQQAFHLKPVPFRKRFLVFLGIATLLWGFSMISVPSLHVAEGSSRSALSGVFTAFYLLAVGCFALGGLIGFMERAVLNFALPDDLKKLLGSLLAKVRRI